MAAVFTDSKEIRVRCARQVVPAAGGVAAVLAAIMTVSVVPLTAHSPSRRPATSTEPALTRSVDDPGRIAYQSTAACVPNFITYSFDFSAVPKNHRLVVQHVFGVLVFVADARGAQVTLEDGANHAVSAFLAPPSFLRENLFDQPVLQYFDAGSAPFLFVDGDVDQSSVSKATISGYLLDCATTPCAAIAP